VSDLGYLPFAALLVVAVARYPHQFVCVGVVVFSCWLWCRLTPSPTAVGEGSYGSCRFCSFTSSSAQRVADHEAGHWVVGEALGCTPYAAWIAEDGSGATYVRGIDTPRQQALISAAGSVAEGLRNNWFFTQSTNGSCRNKNSDKAKLVAAAREAGMSEDQARREAARLVRRYRGPHRVISARLMRDGKIG
jgi:hypothetical protein